MKQMITKYLITFITDNNDYTYEYDTNEDRAEYIKEILSQIEQNSYNNGFIALHEDDESGRMVRINEIKAIEYDTITLTKREYEKFSKL